MGGNIEGIEMDSRGGFSCMCAMKSYPFASEQMVTRGNRSLSRDTLYQSVVLDRTPVAKAIIDSKLVWYRERSR